MLRRSSAMCQPGLKNRPPSTLTLATRPRRSCRATRACSISSALRMMPTRSFIDCCRSDWIVYGFSPPCRRERRQRRLLRRRPRRRRRPPAGAAEAVDVVGGGDAGAHPEHQQVRQRVAAEPVGAVHAAGDLADREQPGDPGLLGVRVDLDAAHHVVAGRADLHRLGGDVDVGQLLELVVHRGQPALDLVGRQPGRDVQEHAAVRGPAAGLDLRVDGPGDLVAGQQLGRAAVVVRVGVPAVGLLLGGGVLVLEDVRDVVEHEALALGVLAARRRRRGPTR